MYIKNFRPIRSIKNIPIMVAIKFMNPTPTDDKSEALSPIPVSAKILGE